MVHMVKGNMEVQHRIARVSKAMLEEWLLYPWEHDRGYSPGIFLEVLADFANMPLSECYRRCKGSPAFIKYLGRREHSKTEEDVYTHLRFSHKGRDLPYNPLKALEELFKAYMRVRIKRDLENVHGTSEVTAESF